MPANADDLIDSLDASQSSELVIRNTFLEVPQQKEATLRRCNSESDISSSVVSVSEWKNKAETSPNRSTHDDGSVRNTSRTTSPRSWADMSDDMKNDGDEGRYPDDKEFYGDWVPVVATTEALELVEKLLAMVTSRCLPPDVVATLAQDDTINEHIPLDPQGNLTSLGSILHGDTPHSGTCKPCLFFCKGRCSKGHLCIHCHLPHPAQEVEQLRRKRIRASKATRARRAKMFTDEGAVWANDEDNTSASNAGCSTASSEMNSSGSSPNNVDMQPPQRPSTRTIISL